MQQKSSLSPQRRRNRQALLKAARELMAEGLSPSVTDAADRAEISRATAYRYFSSAEKMQNEAALDAVVEVIDEIGVEGGQGGDLAGRAAALVTDINRLVSDHEAEFRTMLRYSLEVEKGGRAGRRLAWLSALLEQADIDAARSRRLIGSLALLCGIEAQVVLKDVCHMQEDEIRETLAWTAAALVRQALSETG